MNDMSAVITAKSDQLNADDLMSGPITIRVADVTIRPGTEQPVSVHFEGDSGKPWKTCKSMNRVLVLAWGADASKYKGRYIRIFRDPTVKWGGMEVGGLRISHLSHIQAPLVTALTATKGSKKVYTVQVLEVPAEKPAVTLRLIKPDGTEFVAEKGIAQWVKGCEAAIGKQPNATAMAKWNADMAPHYLAAEHVDIGAVEHVQKLASDRMDALADAAESAAIAEG